MIEGRREPSSAPPSECPSEDKRTDPHARVGPHEPIVPDERIGPLLVEHHRKADGRSLILYREVAEDG